jgi:hypothetical protein
MIRNGNYCIYNGREFELSEDMDENLIILSENPASLKEKGFVDRFNSGVYSKVVKPSELTKCYRIITKGKLDGKVVNISNENSDEYYVGTLNAEIAKDLGAERTDKYYYEKWVPKERIEIFEEIQEINL